MTRSIQRRKCCLKNEGKRMGNGWKYYNHAMIPDCAPHEAVNSGPLEDGSLWNVEKNFPLLARWTSDFDCGYDRPWWYVIKDTHFDISELKAKRRYEINKGKKNFIVKKIHAVEYVDELYEITVVAYTQYPKKYRPKVIEEKFREMVNGWDKHIVYGAFEIENGKMCGYALLNEYPSYVDFWVLKTINEYEKKGVNASIVAKIIEDFNERLGDEFYICDGARSLFHETAFQDYLEKYFGFRKVYCNLNIKYRFSVRIAVMILYPFRKLIRGNNKLLTQIKTVLELEAISRECIKKCKDNREVDINE